MFLSLSRFFFFSLLSFFLFPILKSSHSFFFKRAISHKDLQVRTSAVKHLFSLLKAHGHSFSQNFWRMIFRGFSSLFPSFPLSFSLIKIMIPSTTTHPPLHRSTNHNHNHTINRGPPSHFRQCSIHRRPTKQRNRPMVDDHVSNHFKPCHGVIFGVFSHGVAFVA